MCDASGNFIQIDGTNTIKIQASAKVDIKVGNAVFEVTPSKISLTAEHIEINGTTDAKMFSGSAEFKTESGGEAKMKGTKAIVQDTGSNKISADGKIEITGTGVKVDGTTGMTEIKGVNVKVN